MILHVEYPAKTYWSKSMCNFYVTKYIIMEHRCIAHSSFILQPLAIWHMFYIYIYKQCDVNNTEHRMSILAFKFWSSALHYGHLILVPDG